MDIGIMNERVRRLYVLVLGLSVLMYAIPFKYGGNFMRFGLGLLAVGVLGYILWFSWSAFKKQDPVAILLLLVNGVAVLHFVLIFLIIVVDPRYLLIYIAGLLLAVPIFLVVDNRMKLHINDKQNNK